MTAAWQARLATSSEGVFQALAVFFARSPVKRWLRLALIGLLLLWLARSLVMALWSFFPPAAPLPTVTDPINPALAASGGGDAQPGLILHHAVLDHRAAGCRQHRPGPAHAGETRSCAAPQLSFSASAHGGWQARCKDGSRAEYVPASTAISIGTLRHSHGPACWHAAVHG